MGEILLSGQTGAGKTLLLLKIMRKGKFKNVIWVTTTRSARALRKILGEDVWIVDTHTWSHTKIHPRDVVIVNPINLNEVNLGVSRLLDSVGKNCLVVFDSLTGLLLYHDLHKLIYFLRGVLVKIEEKNASAIFTYVKGAHSTEVEFSLYTMFPVVMEILNTDDYRKKIIKIIKATEWVEEVSGEAEIVKDDIIVPENIMNYIMKVLSI